ncbi:potassium channel family protein [Candidatus Synechococcus calcipolaris G9]|uniref:Potassium channel family protein n=1 Tax=Candidatus Synechococcus calcipolaris G9 TaxID=1497997 RepID=A0ABT6F3M0_9SYNE|nr:potassium channel family protein [Candidatus Synechococcus calcipolaris]MDG2992377.1 potassium channel family protein [Candidatus Synechococcus calcipolaris G9]
MGLVPRHELFLQNQYSQLLTAQLFLILLPTLFPQRKLALTVAILMLTVVVVLIVRTFRIRHTKFLVYCGLIFGVGLIQIFTVFMGILQPYHQVIIVMANLVYLTFVAISIYLTMNSIFRQELVTSDSIRGGICVYFLLGYFFYFAYRIVYTIYPESFKFPHDYADLLDLIYFSFVSLTTIGYGDITPTIPITMSLAIIEGLFGQMYPAVVIAQLVSQYINSSSRSS